MKKIIAIITTLTLTLGMFSCSKDNKADSKAADSKQQSSYKSLVDPSIDLSKVVIKVGAAAGANGHSVIKAAGLDNTPYKVEFTVFQGGNLVLEAMAANQLDLGTGSQIPPIFASQAQNGGNLKIIGIRKAATLDQELVVPKDSPIKSVAELKGKKVAYVKNTTAHYFLAKMLENAGLSWNDVETVPLSTSDGLTALLTKQVDALASYDNSIRTAHSKGATTLQSADKILSGDFYWYATPAAISDTAKHAAIVDYLNRYNEASEWARKNPEKWAKEYAPQINQKTEDFLADYNNQNKQSIVRVLPIDEATIASEQDIVNTFGKIGVLKQGIDIRPLFDRSFDNELSKFKKY